MLKLTSNLIGAVAAFTTLNLKVPATERGSSRARLTAASGPLALPLLPLLLLMLLSLVLVVLHMVVYRCSCVGSDGGVWGFNQGSNMPYFTCRGKMHDRCVAE